MGIPGVSEVEIEESRARSTEQRKDEEANALLAKMPEGAKVLLLHEGGRPSSSVELAGMVARTRDQGVPAFCFAIGGPDGFAPSLLARHDTLSFGAATFPHQLVRVLVAEQIYRINDDPGRPPLPSGVSAALRK